MNEPNIGIPHFLDRLLQPIFDRVAKQKTLINGIDFVRQLENYRERDHVRAATQFVTFDVTDLYTIIARNGTLHPL